MATTPTRSSSPRFLHRSQIGTDTPTGSSCPRFLHRSQSGTATPRLCHVSLPDRSPPFSLNLPRSRSKSTSKSHPAAPMAPQPKENRESPSPRDRVPASRKTAAVAPSAWALSPGRSQPAKEPKAAGWMRGGRVLGWIRSRKEPSAKEEEAHRLRIIYSRLLQWRFANARAQAAAKARRSAAEKKLFYAWLRISELGNIVAAKRILIQRREQKLKLFRIIGPQIWFLSQWESLAKKNAEAVAALSRVLGTACLSVPLVEGAKVDMVSVHRHISTAMNAVRSIEDTVRTFYHKVERMSSLLSELVSTVTSEIEGMEELLKSGGKATALEIHEISLRANVIQVMKDEVYLTPLSSEDGVDYVHNQALAGPLWDDYSSLLMQVY